MIETELAEIESRLPEYSADAQTDIRWLLREVRRLHDLGLRDAGPPSSAIFDNITGLLSGGAYGVRFAMARARAARNKKFFAVMSVELALSKSAAAGVMTEREAQEALKQVASRLVACARETDTVARIDTEKFVMILEDLAVPDNAERVKQKVEIALAEPIVLGERAIRAAASISFQFYPEVKPAGGKRR